LPLFIYVVVIIEVIIIFVIIKVFAAPTVPKMNTDATIPLFASAKTDFD